MESYKMGEKIIIIIIIIMGQLWLEQRLLTLLEATSTSQ